MKQIFKYSLMAIDALHFLLDLQKFARKSFEWWDDAALMEMPLVYMPSQGMTKVCIHFPTEKVNAWDFIQSKAQADQQWVAAGILSCIGKGYSLNRLTINWEARDLRYVNSK